MLDAEGCIRLAKQVKQGKSHYSPRVYVSNQSRTLMNWLVLHFGGQYVKNVNSGRGLEWYIWYLQSRESVPYFLNLVSPYLKLKKQQADCLLEFCSLYDSLSDEHKEKYFQKLKELKVIGSVTTETLSDYKKADQSYLAGYFDGEGCITISKTSTGAAPQYHLVAQITNTDLPMLELCRRVHGGSIRHKQGGRCFDWMLSGKQDIERFLLQTLPYLVVKRDEAKVALEYIRLGNHTRCPASKESLRLELRRLKQSKIQSELHGDVQSERSGSYDSINT